MEVMEESGHKFETILVCGGLSKNPMFVRSQANAVSKAVLVPEESESVLVGAAILGATASGIYKNVLTAVKHMGSKADKIEPSIETQKLVRPIDLNGQAVPDCSKVSVDPSHAIDDKRHEQFHRIIWLELAWRR